MANYVGNNDYRGWLNYLAKNGSTTAAGLLKYAGNDGGVSDRNAADSFLDDNITGTCWTNVGKANDYYYSQWQQNQAAEAAANNQAGYGGSGGGGSSRRSSSGSTTTSSAQAAKDAKMRSYYDQLINQKNNAINDLGGALQNELDRIKGEYGTYRNEQQSSYNKAKNEYDNSSKQNLQALVTNRNEITDNASRGLRSLLRVLGAMGAGGGSVARYNAPDVVKAQADKENNAANKTYTQNQQNLDTDWGNYQNEYENDKKKLEDWKNGQISKAKQDVEKQRISLLEQLSEAIGNRSQYGGDASELGNITNRIAAANATIRDLGRYAQPNYNGMTANYEAKPLSTYDTGQTDLSTRVEDADSAGNTGLLSLLRSAKKKQGDQYLYGIAED